MADIHSPGPNVATEVAMRVVLALKHQPGALLPVLHGIRDELGFIPAPTALAVRLAKDAGVTLIGFLRGDECVIYSHAERIAA